MLQRVTLVFDIDQTSECNGDPHEFAEVLRGWAKRDPIGWLHSLPLAERFPVAVRVQQERCRHTMFSDGYCGEMTCSNYYNRRPDGIHR